MPRLFLIMCLGLSACSYFQEDQTLNWPAERLFETAKEEQQSGNYTTASGLYTKLMARYPYGLLAQQSALNLAYSYFKDGENDKAIQELNAFIRTYPRHPQIDYAYYMKGIIAYERNQSFFKRLNPTNLAQTDPNLLKEAFMSFNELVQLFPNSQYSEDARYRMVYLKNLIAQHDLEIAEHYLREGAYLASIKRAQNVVTQYQQTPSTPYALAVMTRAYRELGDEMRSNDSQQILEMNFRHLLDDEEIQNILHGNIKRKDSLIAILKSKPKI